MTPKELVELLQQLPKDIYNNADIRVINSLENDDLPNQWVQDIEFNESDGEFISAEVILLTSE